ncbi:DUF805 domain-containing protein [bacterium]|nr:DUF805 domain-containing protein [bacterium]
MIFLWITFALTVKRLHDIDYSGWGIFFFLIPFYNFYFSIIFYFVK